MKFLTLVAATVTLATYSSVGVCNDAISQLPPAPKSSTALVPFSAETNYLSLAGYYRQQNFIKTGRWISIKEANQRAKGTFDKVHTEKLSRKQVIKLLTSSKK